MNFMSARWQKSQSEGLLSPTVKFSKKNSLWQVVQTKHTRPMQPERLSSIVGKKTKPQPTLYSSWHLPSLDRADTGAVCSEHTFDTTSFPQEYSECRSKPTQTSPLHPSTSYHRCHGCNIAIVTIDSTDIRYIGKPTQWVLCLISHKNTAFQECSSQPIMQHSSEDIKPNSTNGDMYQ